jgi:hypothetical protein
VVAGEFGLVASYASGEDDGTGFLMPMAFAQSNGYWGYTGILTIQGPTDTGSDGDAVNMSNNGYGMSSIQARYSSPVTDALTAYFSAGCSATQMRLIVPVRWAPPYWPWGHAVLIATSRWMRVWLRQPQRQCERLFPGRAEYRWKQWSQLQPGQG